MSSAPGFNVRAPRSPKLPLRRVVRRNDDVSGPNQRRLRGAAVETPEPTGLLRPLFQAPIRDPRPSAGLGETPLGRSLDTHAGSSPQEVPAPKSASVCDPHGSPLTPQRGPREPRGLKRRSLLLAAGLAACVAVSSAAADPIVFTDRDDYSPGDTVIVAGAGWHPGEVISLIIYESPVERTAPVLTAVADSAGELYENQYLVEPHDRATAFTLVARGGTSGLEAITSFTDGADGEFRVGPDAVPTGLTTTFTLTFTNQKGSTAGGHTDNTRGFKVMLDGFGSLTDLRVATTENSRWTISSARNVVTAIAVDATADQLHRGQALILTVTATAPATVSSRTWTARGFTTTDCSSGACRNKDNIIAVVASPAPIRTATAAPTPTPTGSSASSANTSPASR